MVWLVIGLPFSAVVAGIATVMIARDNADSLVKEGYIKEGFTVRQTLDADKLAMQLGITADLKVRDDILAIRLTSSVAQLTPSSLHLTLAHPTDASQDASLTLFRGGDGVYLTRVPAFTDAKRTLILEADDRTWRLIGTWATPFPDDLRLTAQAAGS